MATLIGGYDADGEFALSKVRNSGAECEVLQLAAARSALLVTAGMANLQLAF
jgi:hypothetical protein